MSKILDDNSGIDKTSSNANRGNMSPVVRAANNLGIQLPKTVKPTRGLPSLASSDLKQVIASVGQLKKLSNEATARLAQNRIDPSHWDHESFEKVIHDIKVRMESLLKSINKSIEKSIIIKTSKGSN